MHQTIRGEARKRVFIFDINGLRGGSAQSLQALLNHIAPSRWEVILGFGRRGNRYRWSPYAVYEANMAGYDNYDFAPMTWNIRSAYGLFRWLVHLPYDFVVSVCWLRRIRPDVVHLNVGQALTMGLAAHVLRLPVLWHVREMVCDNSSGRFQQWVYKTCAAKIVAISRAVVARLPACSQKVAVVPNGVDVASPALEDIDTFRKLHGLSASKFTILLLGGLQISKGYLFLADVADRVAGESGIIFVLAGDTKDVPATGLHRLFRWLYRTMRKTPGEKKLIQRRWRKIVEKGEAVFTGQVQSNIAIAASSIVVCPNLTTEPFGRTVIEAYAQAKPVITANIPAFDEIVEEGVTGWMLPSKTDLWAAKLLELARNHEKVRVAGEFGLQKVRAFNGQAYADRIMSLYSDILHDQSLK